MNVPITLTGLQTVNADEIYIEGTDVSNIFASNDANNTNSVNTQSNTDDIAILNTKQLQNFTNIDAINTNLN